MYYIGDQKTLDRQYEVAAKFFAELRRPGASPKDPPFLSLQAAALLIPDLAQLESIGVLRVPMPENPATMRRLNPGEDIPQDAYLFITDRARALQLAAEYAEKRIESLEGWDAFYPHDPALASRIFSWYDLLLSSVTDTGTQRRYGVEAERWAKATTDRSPEVAWWWINYAKALWMRGNIEPGAQGLAYFFTGLDYYRRAHELYPGKGEVALRYAQALEKLGEALVNAGRADDGRRLVAESREMFERADLLARYDALVR
jgi:tetratricopeptide (TPR) repeat protein